MSFTLSRDLRLVISAWSISLLGEQIALVALILRAQGAGHGAWPVVSLLLAGLTPLALFAPLVGRLVDRTDSKPLLVLSSAGQLVCCLALAWTPDVRALLALVFLLGIGQAVNAAGWQALLPSIVSDDGAGSIATGSAGAMLVQRGATRKGLPDRSTTTRLPSGSLSSMV